MTQPRGVEYAGPVMRVVREILAGDPGVRCMIRLTEAEIRRGWHARDFLGRVARGKGLVVDARTALVKR